MAVLSNPCSEDKVYSVLEGIFSSQSDHVLTRDMSIRKDIKRLAWRRFILGYPPRKQTDTSIGDAINWEWIIHCASFLSGRFIIVSRDSDFGCEHSGRYFLNDQLEEEFRNRCGQVSIIYTRKLADALKSLGISVTKQERQAEEATMRHTDVLGPVLGFGRKPCSLCGEMFEATNGFVTVCPSCVEKYNK